MESRAVETIRLDLSMVKMVITPAMAAFLTRSRRGHVMIRAKMNCYKHMR